MSAATLLDALDAGQPKKPRAVALAGNNTGGINDGPFARSQPGYKGANGRYAAFETPEHGLAAQRALLASYVQRGFDTPAKIAARWAPGSDGNNPSAYAATVARQMGIGVGDKITPAQLDAFAHAQAKVENGAYVPPAAAPLPDSFGSLVSALESAPGKGAPAAPVAVAAPAAKVAPQPQPSAGERLARGLGKGAIDLLDGSAQLVERGITAAGDVVGIPNAGPRLNAFGAKLGMNGQSADQIVKQRAADYAKALGPNGPGVAGTVGEFIGNAVPGAIMAMGSGGASLPMTAARLGISGAASGATQPVENMADYWGAKGKQAAAGAVGGVVGGKALQGVARVVSPKVNAMVQTLQKNGVPLTIGQIAGANGGVIGSGIRTIEDAARSIPFLGNAITGAQRRSLEGFSRAGVADALKEIGVQLPPNVATGHDAIEFAQSKVGAAYQAIAPKLATRADQPFIQSMLNIVNMAASPTAMTPAMAQRVQSIFRDDVMRRFSKNGSISGEAFRELESKLGQTAKAYRTSPDPDHRQFGAAVSEMQEQLRALAERTNPAQAADLKKLHLAFRKLTIAEDAASRGNDGVATAAAYSQAMRRADASARKKAVAAGGALQQDLATAGRGVLPSTVPDSGTFTRATVGGALALGSNAAGAAIPAAVGIGAGIGAGTALYSKPGQRLAAALLTKRPPGAKAAAGAIRKGVPLAAALGARGAVSNAQE